MLPRSFRHGLPLALTLFWVLLTAGCSNKPTMCRVTGTVRYQGKAVPHITVRFVPADGPESIGDTDESGVYKLTHGKAKSEGAVRGKHKVFFVYRPRTPQEEMDIQSGKASPPPEIVAILAKYGSLDTTTLSFEVKDDGQVIDIPLD